MKIAFIDRALLKKRKNFVRGVELFNINLIKDLLELGYEVHLYLHSSWLNYELLKNHSKLVSHKFCFPQPELAIPKIIIDVLTIKYERIIIGNVSNGFVLLLLLLRLFCADFKKIILIAHRTPKKIFLLLSPKKWKKIICVNSLIAKRFMDYHFTNVIVEYGKNHPEHFYPAEQKKLEAPINFCMLGNLDSPWKGAAFVIESFKKLPPDIKKLCQLHLASYQDPQKINSENIFTYKSLPPNDIPDWLRKMDVMIVASYDEGEMRETFCMAMVEGMLTGLPIIISNFPVLTEKITEGGGLVFNSVDELTSLMIKLALDPAMRQAMGSKAREIALKKYVWNTASFASKYLEQ